MRSRCRRNRSRAVARLRAAVADHSGLEARAQLARAPAALDRALARRLDRVRPAAQPVSSRARPSCRRRCRAARRQVGAAARRAGHRRRAFLLRFAPLLHQRGARLALACERKLHSVRAAETRCWAKCATAMIRRDSIARSGPATCRRCSRPRKRRRRGRSRSTPKRSAPRASDSRRSGRRRICAVTWRARYRYRRAGASSAPSGSRSPSRRRRRKSARRCAAGAVRRILLCSVAARAAGRRRIRRWLRRAVPRSLGARRPAALPAVLSLVDEYVSVSNTQHPHASPASAAARTCSCRFRRSGAGCAARTARRGSRAFPSIAEPVPRDWERAARRAAQGSRPWHEIRGLRRQVRAHMRRRASRTSSAAIRTTGRCRSTTSSG